MKSINRKDLLIVSNLRRNGRETLTEISKFTGIPVSTIFDRIKNKCFGLIKKNTILIDFNMLGYSIVVHMVLKVNKSEREKLKEYVKKHRHINTAYRINNGYDYLLEGVFKNVKDLEEFLEKLDENFSIEQKQIYHIIDEIKREEFLSPGEYINSLSS